MVEGERRRAVVALWLFLSNMEVHLIFTTMSQKKSKRDWQQSQSHSDQRYKAPLSLSLSLSAWARGEAAERREDLSGPDAATNTITMERNAGGVKRMHEDSVNSVTSFCHATFTPASGLNKIDANPKCPDDSRSDERRCELVPRAQGRTTSPTGAHRGHREQASANRGSNTHLSGAGLYASSSHDDVCLTRAEFLRRTSYGVASTRNLDVHVGTSTDKTWEYPMLLMESHYFRAPWFDDFLRHAPLLHAPPHGRSDRFPTVRLSD
jgi:hypothetical protein